MNLSDEYSEDDGDELLCETCLGTGKITSAVDGEEESCPACAGTGYINDDE